MLVTLAGAMSTAELGLSLAEMIRQDKVHAIVCTGANLEEDIFNLVAHDYYERVPHYRHLTPRTSRSCSSRHMNRVTDTCIPETRPCAASRPPCSRSGWPPTRPASAISRTSSCTRCCARVSSSAELPDRPEELVDARRLREEPAHHRARLGGRDPRQHVRRPRVSGDIKNVHTVRTGIEYMMWLAEWYTKTAKKLRNGEGSIGFFQIGGGIAGDFPICVVPMLHQDLQPHRRAAVGLLRQISDSTTSYGSYSGAVPNEKITWGKLGVDTPKFIVESDATIVAPLIFAWVLGEVCRADRRHRLLSTRLVGV
jgi:deoxyhypusine synthase